MSLAVATKEYMAHHRVQQMGTSIFLMIDGAQRIEDPRQVLPALLATALFLMDELNLNTSETIAAMVNSYNHLKDTDIDTLRATREYIRQELINGR